MEVPEDDDLGVQLEVEVSKVSKVDVLDDQEEAEVQKDYVDAGDHQVEVVDVQVVSEGEVEVSNVDVVDVGQVEVQKVEVQ